MQRALLPIRDRLAVVLLLTASVVWCIPCAAQPDDPSEATPSAKSSERSAPRTPPPGAATYSDALAAKLWNAYEAQGPDYEPRTEHRRDDGSPVYVNRLILEDSPYLIQHAHNPVDWYPWGPEAFERAQRENKPIFLSIGYSTCHWCHVMERESFDHEEVARLMNEHFVSIKVDREQRPDVDEVYMTAVHIMGQRGGWPMSSFLTSEGDSFFGGTYYPRAQFLQLLDSVVQAWAGERPRIQLRAQQVTSAVHQATAASVEAARIDADLLKLAVSQSLSRHDGRLGGFSPAPKFPHEPELLFLLDQMLRRGDERALAAATTTLDHMARGGIYDQVGGGFHRYSTDARWLVPHFEKMLYNQAHLARAYFQASRLTGDLYFERVARQTLDYVLRDMTAPGGGFYSATDADSEGREGEFFVWTPQELRAALPEQDAELALRLYGVTAAGNFEGKSILHLPKHPVKMAAELGIPLEGLLDRVDRIRQRLYEVREEREHPLLDDKIVTAWNGMMITTLAEAGDGLGEPRYVEAAERAAEFLWQHNRRPDGRLWRAFLGGSASVEANHNDYAYLLEAFAGLYDATGEARWLERADEVSEVMVDHFWDDAAGGFYMSEGDHGGRLPTRPKSPTDGAIPSGNSVAVRGLALLAERTGEPATRQRAEAALAAFSGQVRRQPTAFAYMLLGADELLHGVAGPLEYGARGVVKAKALVDGNGRLELILDLAEGWHVNSDQPLQEELIPTRLAVSGEGWSLDEVVYPEPDMVKLGFQEEPLALFQGTVAIRGTLRRPEAGEAVIPLQLTVQACDDRKCLQPEDLELEVPWPQTPTADAGAVSSSAALASATAVAVIAGAGWWLWWRTGHR